MPPTRRHRRDASLTPKAGITKTLKRLAISITCLALAASSVTASSPVNARLITDAQFAGY